MQLRVVTMKKTCCMPIGSYVTIVKCHLVWMILIESEAVELNHLSLQRKTLYARRF